MSRPSRAPKSPLRWLGAATVIGLTAATFSAVVGSPAQAVDWSACLDGSKGYWSKVSRVPSPSLSPAPGAGAMLVSALHVIVRGAQTFCR